VRQIEARGRRARYIPTVAEIVSTVAREAREGDLVVAMSNGGFDDIHTKLLSALESRG
jgi:UDP-N-acetylmuramate: L-alanyl-gamma-D-glutamyl-meso-diaminopimelate ligase